MKHSLNRWLAGLLAAGLLMGFACSNTRLKNQAKEAAARYWQEKAYPGKSFDVKASSTAKLASVHLTLRQKAFRRAITRSPTNATNASLSLSKK